MFTSPPPTHTPPDPCLPPLPPLPPNFQHTPQEVPEADSDEELEALLAGTSRHGQQQHLPAVAAVQAVPPEVSDCLCCLYIGSQFCMGEGHVRVCGGK
jgi:hypothetical protein